MLRRLLIAALSLLALVACATTATNAPIEEVQRAAYRAPGAPSITLITAINNRSGEGGHSALMISGSQRVMFDPAGTWWHPTVPEVDDVLYGMTPLMLDYYTDYHARVTYHVVFQKLEVTRELADRAIELAQASGPAAKATCGLTVSGILRQLGFSEVRQSWFPNKIMQDFGTIPGVTERKVYDNSPDANAEILAAQKAARLAEILGDT